MNMTHSAPPVHFVAGRVCEMRMLFTGEVEFRVSGKSHGNPIRVAENDPLWKRIRFRAHVLVVYEAIPGLGRVRLIQVKIKPTMKDILAL